MSILVEQLTPEHTGTSQAALDAARAIFRLDGLAPFRRSLDDTYDECAAVADWARAVDRENHLLAAAPDLLKAAKSALNWLHYCDMTDTAQYARLWDAIAKANGTK